MPNGDLITAHWQWQIRDYLIGTGAWLNDRSRSIGGLGNPEPKISDLPYAGRDGSFGGQDSKGVRTITIPLLTNGDGITDEDRQADANANLEGLEAAWALSAIDIRLDCWLPGRPFYAWGRPRGIDADLSKLTFGRIEVLCTFATTEDSTLYPATYPIP